MTQQVIDIGSAPDDSTGDPLRTSFNKCNDNFTELYAAATGGGNVSNSGTPTAGQYGKWVTATTIQGVAPATVLSDIGAAPLASPVLTGDPQAPTPATTDNDTSIATTAFVKTSIAAVANQTYYFDPTSTSDVGGYKQLLQGPSTDAESTVPVSCSGTSDVLIGSFITNPGIPGAIDFPAGSAYRRLYGSVSGGVARFHLQMYVRSSGGIETLARDEFSQSFSSISATLIEYLATPSGTSLLATDRIVVKVYAQRVSGPTTITVTFFAEGSSHASQVQTTIPVGAGSGSAPVGAEYITSTADATLTAERVLTDTATVTWDRTTAGQIKANAAGASATSVPPQGRLTLQTATPVMTTTQSAKTTLFYTPYVGNQIVLYNGTTMVPTTFAELSNLTTASAAGNAGPAAVAANSVYDLFVWSNAGTPTLTRGPAWSSDTARSAGTALVMVGGIWLNNAAITNGPAIQRGTYVGTTRSNASSQLDWIFGGVAAGGTAAWFGVWNAYNRVTVATSVVDTTASRITASGGVVEPLLNSVGNRVNYVAGLEEDGFSISVNASGAAGAGSLFAVGVGYDVTNAFANGSTWAGTQQTPITPMNAAFAITGLGWHFMQALQSSNGPNPGGVYSYGTNGSLAAGLIWNGRM